MNNSQEIIGGAVTLITAAGAGFAAAYTWLNRQIKAAKVELKAEFDKDINQLKTRVEALEHGQAEARAVVWEGYAMAVAAGSSDMAAKWLEAERVLR